MLQKLPIANSRRGCSSARKNFPSNEAMHDALCGRVRHEIVTVVALRREDLSGNMSLRENLDSRSRKKLICYRKKSGSPRCR